MLDRESLNSELMKLRQKEGLTVGRMDEATTLLEVLGNPPLQVAYDILIGLLDDIAELPETQREVKTLRITLGLDNNVPGWLTDRQQFCATTAIGADMTTIKKYEKRAIKELIAALEHYLTKSSRRPTRMHFELQLVRGVLVTFVKTPYYGDEQGEPQTFHVDASAVQRDRFIWVADAMAPTEAVSFEVQFLDGHPAFSTYFSRYATIDQYNVGEPNFNRSFTCGRPPLEGARGITGGLYTLDCKPGQVFGVSWDYRGRRVIEPWFSRY